MSNYEKYEENHFAENFVDFSLILHWFSMDLSQEDAHFCTNQWSPRVGSAFQPLANLSDAYP